VKRQSLPTISIVTADLLQDFKSISNVVVVGYFAPDDCISYEAFKSVAEAMQEDYLFGVTNDDTLAKAEQINVPSIALYKNFDEGKNVFELTHDSQAITTFVKAASTPLVVEFLPELHASYVTVSLKTHD
jgi:protein disulfide-isomerase A1